MKSDRSAEVLHHFGTRLHHRIPSSCLRGTGQVKPHLYGPGPVLRYRVITLSVGAVSCPSARLSQGQRASVQRRAMRIVGCM